MDIIIRKFRDNDAEIVSHLIHQTLFAINTKEYTNHQLATVAQEYTVEVLHKRAQKSTIFIAEIEGKIVGTATLTKNKIRGVFVAHDAIGNGVGRHLMETIENEARLQGFRTIYLITSLTAHGFYKKLGYKDDKFGKLGIDMHKELTVPVL